MDTANHHFAGEAFAAFPVIGILRGFDTAIAVEAARCVADAGLTAIEVTMNTAAALDQISALRRALPNTVRVGAGTVLSADDVRRAASSGAEFMVSPITHPAIMGAAAELGMPVFPGAMTPTEIQAAHIAGAVMVKLFPAAALGAAYLRAVLGPLEGVSLLPTGGIGLGNIADFLRAGAAGFGIGSPLFDRRKLRDHDWAWLQTRTRMFRAIVERERADGA